MTRWAGREPADKIVMIIDVYRKGYSASDIAKALMGQSTETPPERITRNAIIGFYHRTRINAEKDNRLNPLRDCPLQDAGFNEEEQHRRRMERVNRTTARKREDRERQERKTFKLKVVNNKAENIEKALVAPVTTDDEGYGVRMSEVGDQGCMWPTSSSGSTILFCNHQIAGKNKRYCDLHQRRSGTGISITQDIKMRHMR